MPERAIQLAPGFSVADAEDVHFAYGDGELRLEFVDWRGGVVRVGFENTAGVSWAEVVKDHPQERDDSVYEVIESQWLALYAESGERTEGDNLRHFRLNFNAHGTLDVLASSMRRVES